MKSKLKGLFVCHVPASSTYGAATSFRLLIDSLHRDISATLVIPRPLNPFRDKGALADAEATHYTCMPKDLYMEYLPWDVCYEGKPLLSNQALLTVRNGYSEIFRWRFRQLLRKGNFDFVYLNSLALNPLINEDPNTFIHVREVFNGKGQARLNRLSRAKGVIFIDKLTRDAFVDKISARNEVILNNPFDMLHLKDVNVSREQYFSSFSIDCNPKTRVFSCIGTVLPMKGVDFVIKSFTRARLSDALLLIVGQGYNSAYRKLCKKAAENDKRVLFLGEVKDMAPIYLFTDFVLRGDPDFRIGRTVFEGLYSGCGTILPGKQKDIDRISEFKRFKEKISVYHPRNLEDLIIAFQECETKPRSKRVFESNTDEYSNNFYNFITRSLSSNPKPT